MTEKDTPNRSTVARRRLRGPDVGVAQAHRLGLSTWNALRQHRAKGWQQRNVFWATRPSTLGRQVFDAAQVHRCASSAESVSSGCSRSYSAASSGSRLRTSAWSTRPLRVT